MNPSNPSTQLKHTHLPVYGFLDPNTNQFYAFQSEQQYRAFLDLLQAERQRGDDSMAKTALDQEEMEKNFEWATQEMMKVFEDPMFQSEDNNGEQLQMREIDF